MVAINRRDYLQLEVIDSPASGAQIDLVCRWSPSAAQWSRELTPQPSDSEFASDRFARCDKPLEPNFDLHIPTDGSNLVHRALSAFMEQFGIQAALRARLNKRIPSGAGMGGASSDAASALLCAAKLFDVNPRDAQLFSIAANLGSDVPFFLGSVLQGEAGGGRPGCLGNEMAAFGQGRGEKLTPFPIHGGYHFVVVYPPVAISTAKAYAKCKIPPHPASADELMQSLQTGRTSQLAHLLINRLTESAVHLSPWIERTLKSIRRAGLETVTMTGSGSACLGVARSASHARRVAQVLTARRAGVCFTATPTCLPAPVLHVA